MIRRFLLILIILFPFIGRGQYAGHSTISFESLYSTGNDLPFWFSHNQSGRYDTLTKSVQALSVQSYHRFNDLFGSPLNLKLGIDGSFQYNNHFSFRFNELYAKTFLWNFKLEAGWFHDEENFSGLSSSNGDLTRSLNARPYPKVRFGTDQFIPFFFFKEWFSFKAEYDEGWLGDDRYVKGTHLHHKSLYGKFRLNNRCYLTAGLNHFVMWGGISPLYGQLPDDFHSYLLYITGQAGDAKFLETDQYNVAGNQLGSYYLQLDVIRDRFNLTFYYSHPFEDRSGMEYDNWRDNLIGAYFMLSKRALINKVVYEFMYTLNQSGPIHQYHVMRGRDNYFNHGIYMSGFTYREYTLASPLFSPLTVSDGVVRGIANNRLVMHHLGVEGSISTALTWKGLFTYSHNLGTYNNPYENPKNQFSSLLSFTYSTPSFPVDLSLAAGVDLGDMYQNRCGILIQISKKW